jgi:hypothetical protein
MSSLPSCLRFQFAMLAFASLLGASIVPAHGADGWPWNSPLNPSEASADDEQPEWLQWIASSSSTSSSSSYSFWSGWTTPKMPTWSSSKPNSFKSYSPRKTTWQKFQDGSKRAWRKTLDVLDPYPDPKPPSASSNSKNNWMSSWGQSKEKKINSVPDFLKQESPR